MIDEILYPEVEQVELGQLDFQDLPGGSPPLEKPPSKRLLQAP